MSTSHGERFDSMPQARVHNLLRASALIAVVAGAAGSLGLMLWVGRNSPRVLLVLFFLWDLSPFVALLVAERASTRWAVPTRRTLFAVMLVIALASLAIYGTVVFVSPKTPTATFLMVPFGSWLLMATVPASAKLRRLLS